MNSLKFEHVSSAIWNAKLSAPFHQDILLGSFNTRLWRRWIDAFEKVTALSNSLLRCLNHRVVFVWQRSDGLYWFLVCFRGF